ncbi:MAG: pilus assembly protein PilM [Verrucomicrobia bacterium]|nr:pilus assembly protein PilM [Verrucomicrobiota bacterium]
MAKKREQIVAIDLGSNKTKAVFLQRKADKLTLAGFLMLDAPVYERTLSVGVLSEHLRAITHTLGAKCKHVCLVSGVADSILRHADVPMVPLSDLRTMVKFGTKNYLQQDMPDYVFDCQLLASSCEAAKPEPGKGPPKVKSIVGGAKKQFVDDLQAAAKGAGLVAEVITTGLIAPANAFETAMPDIFSKEIVALVDFGYRNSTISILLNGELLLSRVVGYGAAKFTAGVGESLGITTAEAENLKTNMTPDVESTIQPLLTPLGRELRASIDFFEHQQDKTVSQVYFSGGSSRSEPIVNALQSELLVPCKSWNAAAGLALALPPQQMGELEQVAPQLAVAIGGAVTALS